MATKQQEVGRLEYITAEGDIFDFIAFRYYNEERMASYIIAANPDYCDTIIFEAGVKLKIPVLKQVESVDTLPPWRR